MLPQLLLVLFVCGVQTDNSSRCLHSLGYVMGLLVPVATWCSAVSVAQFCTLGVGGMQCAWLPAANIKQLPLLQYHALLCAQGVLCLRADGMCMCVRRGQCWPHLGVVGARGIVGGWVGVQTACMEVT